MTLSNISEIKFVLTIQNQIEMDIKNFWLMKYHLDMIIFEQWIEPLFSTSIYKPDSAINLAELYWQGLDPDFRCPGQL